MRQPVSNPSPNHSWRFHFVARNPDTASNYAAGNTNTDNHSPTNTEADPGRTNPTAVYTHTITAGDTSSGDADPGRTNPTTAYNHTHVAGIV